MVHYFLQFLYGAQLERIVNPLMGPERHLVLGNFRGRLNIFLLVKRMQTLFLGPALQHGFIYILVQNSMKLIDRVKKRARVATISRPPAVLKNVMAAKGSWTKRVRTVTEAFPKRFKFFHPVRCPGGALVRRAKWNPRKRTETYKCPGGTKKVFVRSKTPQEFFRRKYGRCSEFAQGLHAVLKYMGIRSRMVLAYKPGFDHVWVEAFNPKTKKWVRLDPTMKKGSYGYTWHLGPKARYFRT
jgi:hypothetical protein